MGEKSGIGAAIEASGASTDQPPIVQPRQLSLIEQPGETAEQALERFEQRRAGRPPGARNKRTEDWMEFLDATSSHPLIHLSKTADKLPEDLAKELGCTKLEAHNIIQAAQTALLPYRAQRLPQSVELNGKGVAAVILTPLDADQPLTIEHKQDQVLIEDGKS